MSTAFPTEDPSWDLETIFEGGVESEAFSEEVDALEDEIEALNAAIEDRKAPREVGGDELGDWRELFDRFFELEMRVSEARSFGFGLASAHTDIPAALRMPSRLDDALTGIRQARVGLIGLFRDISDDDFQAFLDSERFGDMTLWLQELRRDATRSMKPEMEALAVELNRDGFHAWGRLYSEVSGRLEVGVETDDGVKTYSVGQAKNLLDSSERKTRRAAHNGLQKAWGEVAPICASALNAIRGTEQTFYKRRGGDCLTKALNVNRVERQTVEAMFEASAEFWPVLVRYLQAKAKWLGLERLDWYDLRAPVGDDDTEISYADAQRFIVEQAESFSPKIADFCRHALVNQWVEAEDRSGKRQGGYCTSLPVSQEIRIFMTYGGTNTGVTTLAHELGHGYHAAVMKELPHSERGVPMGLAETASTFLEAIVEQAALRKASGETELALLDDRLSRAVGFMMNIPARYELEKKMHSHRSEQSLHEDLLREMTKEAFEEAYGEGVASVDELFWASKLHFFLAGLPFYNFPYTFGYLFSRAVYTRAMQEGEAFVSKIDDLLLDTGRMTSEEVARKHLGADLGDPEFWIDAAGTLVDDVERYETLVSQ